MVTVSGGISQRGYIQLEDLLWAPACWDKVLRRTLHNTSMVSLWHLYGTIMYRGDRASTMTHWTLQISKTTPPVVGCSGGDGGQLVKVVITLLLLETGKFPFHSFVHLRFRCGCSECIFSSGAVTFWAWISHQCPKKG